MTESDGDLCFNVRKGSKVWKGYVEGNMNGENDWNHDV